MQAGSDGIKKTRLRLLLVLGLALTAGACKNDMAALPGVAQAEIEHDRAEDVTFIFSEKGQTKATLKGKEFIRNENAKPPWVDLKNDLLIKFYNDSMHVESQLSAEYGRYYPETGNVLVRDKVVVINQKGEKLETEELVWNQRIERFYTDKFVKITLEDQVSYGEGMEANQDFSWFKIHRQRGSIPVDQSELPVE